MEYDENIIHEDVVQKVIDSMPNDEVFDKLINFHKLIADKTRIKILFALKDNSMCVCDIAACLGMTKSAISHQLKLLRDGNLVKREKIGKEAYYFLIDDHVNKVFNISLHHAEEL